MKKNTLILNIIGIVLLLVNVILFVGSFTFLKTCGPKEDGTWMTCHWAGQAIIGVSCVLVILALANLMIKNENGKIGLSIGVFANTVLLILLPGRLIDTCMMVDMHCNAVTKPSVTVFGVIIIVVAIANILIAAKQAKAK